MNAFPYPESVFSVLKSALGRVVFEAWGMGHSTTSGLSKVQKEGFYAHLRGESLYKRQKKKNDDTNTQTKERGEKIHTHTHTHTLPHSLPHSLTHSPTAVAAT